MDTGSLAQHDEAVGRVALWANRITGVLALEGATGTMCGFTIHRCQVGKTEKGGDALRYLSVVTVDSAMTPEFYVGRPQKRGLPPCPAQKQRRRLGR